ncbi:MAG: hypothetical protein MZV63_71080 [Marinilabiliales bacterium]|nr:hypothetical protein [Marinilabiliales bacterium]
MRAESFSSIRLTPYNDKWIYGDRLLRQSPATATIGRSLVITLLAAAAVVAFIILWPSTAREATDTLPGLIKESTAMSEALIPEASPIIIQGAGEEPTSGDFADLSTVMTISARNSEAKATVSNTDGTISSRTADAILSTPYTETADADKNRPGH